MPTSDAERWDERYRNTSPPDEIDPHEIVERFIGVLPEDALALEVASGWGDNGLYLGSQRAHTTFVDVSQVALDAVGRRAEDLGVEVDLVASDLSEEPLPPGRWDAVVCVHYLDRKLIQDLVVALRPGGHLAIAIATTINRERHEKPSARFLLEPGELETLSNVRPEQVVHYDEAWRSNGVHEAWLVLKGYEVEPIGFEEYDAAFQRFVSCLNESGVAISGIALDPFDRTYKYATEADDEYEETTGQIRSDPCYRKEFEDADFRWQITSPEARSLSAAKLETLIDFYESRGVVLPPPVKASGILPLIAEVGDAALGEQLTDQALAAVERFELTARAEAGSANDIMVLALSEKRWGNINEAHRWRDRAYEIGDEDMRTFIDQWRADEP